mmetsp:Transcript_4619/g.15139  ORF Transcript_4619/g.15139 Transcript_4619/m.15139 type:complete len:209 (+) Transcript_4619:2738-3364(+)
MEQTSRRVSAVSLEKLARRSATARISGPSRQEELHQPSATSKTRPAQLFDVSSSMRRATELQYGQREFDTLRNLHAPSPYSAAGSTCIVSLIHRRRRNVAVSTRSTVRPLPVRRWKLVCGSAVIELSETVSWKPPFRESVRPLVASTSAKEANAPALTLPALVGRSNKELGVVVTVFRLASHPIACPLRASCSTTSTPCSGGAIRYGR